MKSNYYVEHISWCK